MAPNIPGDNHYESREPISTFAVLDLETSNLPEHRNNRVSITELCIYAFDAAILLNNTRSRDSNPADEPVHNELPSAPRVMHKLNLLFQPSMLVLPEAEIITGLSNYLLERESKLNENAGELIKRFVEHLPPPVCLVAHNGWPFDFPIIKQALGKVNISLPASTLCVDSLSAFMAIDDKRNDKPVAVKESTLPIETRSELVDAADNSTERAVTPKEINWQALNESTPKRQILNRQDAALKRQRMDADGTELPAIKRSSNDIKARRQLFTGLNSSSTKRYPPRGVYRLSSLYSRIFERPAVNAHEAEADVSMLTKLIQHYGVDFLAFAEEQSIPFADVVPLSGKAPNSTK
ncbi:uncharacterized protein LOC6576864 isoform X2 [Drosophila mojavensis]|nr:uncharacterized protein LOC6576864 isoform X2 [Drosophila mojavensis]XP_043864447.1 uncharacterized protein LOC6576864 isoform X2 [Drosophila mojavensis]KRG03178.1 uncharacterized protein Dmoj_GI17603, isoform B [Drosophila mojavensis]